MGAVLRIASERERQGSEPAVKSLLGQATGEPLTNLQRHRRLRRTFRVPGSLAAYEELTTAPIDDENLGVARIVSHVALRPVRRFWRLSGIAAGRASNQSQVAIRIFLSGVRSPDER
jgi:hypothetical protein